MGMIDNNDMKNERYNIIISFIAGVIVGIGILLSLKLYNNIDVNNHKFEDIQEYRNTPSMEFL